MAQNLSHRCRRIIRALVEVVKPRKPDFDLPLEDEIVDFADFFVGYMPWHLKTAFPFGLYLLEYGTLIFIGTLRPFSRLSLEERDRYVQGWVDSKLSARRDLIKGMKTLGLSCYYAQPEVMAHLDYDLQAHLNKVNGVGQAPEPASAEACEFFRKLDYDRNEPIPWPARDGLKAGRAGR
jgi:hypothetical protein